MRLRRNLIAKDIPEDCDSSLNAVIAVWLPFALIHSTKGRRVFSHPPPGMAALAFAPRLRMHSLRRGPPSQRLRLHPLLADSPCHARNERSASSPAGNHNSKVLQILDTTSLLWSTLSQRHNRNRFHCKLAVHSPCAGSRK